MPGDLGSLSGMVQPKVESRMILARVRRFRAVERNGYDDRSLPSICFGRTRGENEMVKKLSLSAFALLVLANEVYAQAPATPGTPAAPGTTPSTADDGSGIGWLLPLIALLVIAGLIWYFMKGRNRTSTTSAGTSTLSGTTATRTTGTPGTGGITGTAGTTTGATTSGDPAIRVYDDKKK